MASSVDPINKLVILYISSRFESFSAMQLKLSAAVLHGT